MTLAVIMKLRKRVGLLVGAIAVAIVLFLATDAINSQRNLFGGNDQNMIGKVNGKTITTQEFEAMYNHWLKRVLYFQGYWQQQGFDFTEEQRMQIRNAAWQNLILEHILKNQYKDADILLTQDELDNYLYSPRPRPEVQNFYSQVIGGANAQGFDPQQMRNAVQQIQNIAPDDPLYPARDFFEQLKIVLQDQTLQTKFVALFAKSVYVPEWMASLEFQRRNEAAAINFVSLPYSNVPDEEVKPTDEELANYLEKHNEEFSGPASRSVEYAVFDILPTKADSIESLAGLDEKWDRMQETGRDSMFINQYSLTPYSNGYYPKDEILTTMADTLFKIDTGSYVGPYVENGRYRYIKLYNKMMLPDSVHIRTVFASTQKYGSVDSAMNVIDSVGTLFASGVPFDTLAAHFSDDQASAAKGGDLGWFKPSQNLLRSLFRDFFIDHQPGEAFVAKTTNGVHFAQIIGATPRVPMVQYGIMDREITPGSKTKDSVYSLASRFYTHYGTPDSFDMGLEKYGMTPRYADDVTASTYQYPGITKPVRTITKWAFEKEVGTVALFNSSQLGGEDKYVVAKLSGARSKEPTVEDVREELTAKVVQEKKENKLKDQLATASAGASSMDQIASNLGVDMLSSQKVLFTSNFIEGVGPEPVIAGTAVALQPDQISPPVAGKNGVYLVQQTNYMEAPAAQDNTMLKAQLKSNLRQRFGNTMLDKVQQTAEVVDQRYKFY